MMLDSGMDMSDTMRDLDEKTICDFLAYKAAKALGWDTTSHTWHLGCQHTGYGMYGIIVFCFDRKKAPSFEYLRGDSGIVIMCPMSGDPKKLLASLLTASRSTSIGVHKCGKCIGVVLPQNPPLEQLLLEMDLEDWKKT